MRARASSTSSRWAAAVAALMLVAMLAAYVWRKDGTGEAPAAAPAVAGADAASPAPSTAIQPASAMSQPRYDSLAEVPAEFAGVVTPLALAGEYWPAGELQDRVFTLWRVRVDEVVRGPFQVGETFVLGNLGGSMNPDATYSIESGKLTGSARPSPGGRAEVVEYADYPRFQVGRAELVLLRQFAPAPGETLWLLSANYARFVVAGEGQLTSPLPPLYRGSDAFQRSVEGRRLQEVLAALPR